MHKTGRFLTVLPIDKCRKMWYTYATLGHKIQDIYSTVMY